MNSMKIDTVNFILFPEDEGYNDESSDDNEHGDDQDSGDDESPMIM